MPSIVEVTTTTETAEQAQTIARAIVEQSLAACVQISGPITSVYRWQGKLCQSQEFKCTCKTMDSAVQSLIDAIQKLHPYDVPEILVTNVSGSSPEYEQWLYEQIGAQTDKQSNAD